MYSPFPTRRSSFYVKPVFLSMKKKKKSTTIHKEGERRKKGCCCFFFLKRERETPLFSWRFVFLPLLPFSSLSLFFFFFFFLLHRLHVFNNFHILIIRFPRSSSSPTPISSFVLCERHLLCSLFFHADHRNHFCFF